MLLPRPNINKLAPGIHGGINHAEFEPLGIKPDDVLDFSVSTNPFGPPPGLSQALGNASIDRYPDSESSQLVQALAKKMDTRKDTIITGSGSTELIRLIATAYFGAEDTVLIPQPTYGEYEIACQLVGAKVLKQPTAQEPKFQLNISETADLIQRHSPRGIFLCNPNNPTGQYLSKDEMKQILSLAKDSLVILDEAYIAFTEDGWSSLELLGSGNLIVLRSMTKDYALAGLRLGYAISSEPIISVLKQVRPPWNVSSVAQKAGIFALEADAYLEESSTKIKMAKEFLIKALKGLGFSILPSRTNFFLVKVGKAAEFRQVLLKKGILVRDCTSFGLPEYIRLAPRPMPECQQLIMAIKETGVTKYAG